MSISIATMGKFQNAPQIINNIARSAAQPYYITEPRPVVTVNLIEIIKEDEKKNIEIISIEEV